MNTQRLTSTYYDLTHGWHGLLFFYLLIAAFSLIGLKQGFSSVQDLFRLLKRSYREVILYVSITYRRASPSSPAFLRLEGTTMRRWDRLLDSYIEEYGARGVSKESVAMNRARIERWGR